MLRRLTKYSKIFLSTLLNNIFAAIVVGIIGLPVLISWATGTLDTLLQILKSPVPLWVIIVLALALGIFKNIKKALITISPKKKLCDQTFHHW
jgi:hypothetical protein